MQMFMQVLQNDNPVLAMPKSSGIRYFTLPYCSSEHAKSSDLWNLVRVVYRHKIWHLKIYLLVDLLIKLVLYTGIKLFMVMEM
jgi:hypothetical protein